MILALSLMAGGAITACGQDTAGGQAADPAETAVEAVSVSMDELSMDELSTEETATEEAATEKTPVEDSSAEGTSMRDASIDGKTADETSLDGISAAAAQTDGTAVESAASVISAGTETAAAEVYTSREEAYKALLASLEPSLFVAGKSGNKGSLLVFYDRGSLHTCTLAERYPTWLEAERLLCDSALEGRRHYDRIYSIGETSLTEISGGNYGMAEDGKGWTYIWDGMKMNREGYREALNFIYDRSRAVSFQEQDLRPLAEWIGLWTEEGPDGNTSAAAAVQGDTSAAAETGVTAAVEAGETASDAGDDAAEN